MEINTNFIPSKPLAPENKVSKQPAAEQPQALYKAIADKFRSFILEGVWSVGTIIPSEHELAKTYSASRYTIRRALDDLTRDGYLNRRSGKGTWVTNHASAHELWTMESFARPYPEMTKARIYQTENLRADGMDSSLSGFGKNRLLTRLKLLRSLDGTPLALAYTYLTAEDATRVVAGFDEEKDLFIYQLLERITGRQAARTVERIGAVLAVGEVAEKLHVVSGAPLTFSTRLIYDDSDRLMQAVQLWQRADLYEIKISYTKTTINNP